MGPGVKVQIKGTIYIYLIILKNCNTVGSRKEIAIP